LTYELIKPAGAGGVDMKKYDIVFVGHIVRGKIAPFEELPRSGSGGAAFFSAAAALCCTKNIAILTRMSREDEHSVEPFRNMGIDVYIQYSKETTSMKAVYPTANVDERQLFLNKNAGYFRIDEMPSLESDLIHLSGLSDQEFTIEFMKGLKERGFRLSADMQGFLWEIDSKTHAFYPRELKEKEEILRMLEVVKLDKNEAKILTGTDDLRKAASIIDEWGCSESLITSSEGALAYKDGESHFELFTNKSSIGRTGRGDTTMGAYLARRIDHSVEDSLPFAAALVSIKMEKEGPFMGTLEDVLARMESNRR
jgi:sugar/nucleoside kinase (ribokinase family)